MTRLALVATVALLAAGCGSSSAPSGAPGPAAVRVVQLIVHNNYTQAWGDLHSADQQVAPLAEYVACETRSPVLSLPTSMKVVGVRDESVGLGNGHFVASKAVRIRLAFPGQQNVLVHTVHLIGEHGRWKWILPSWRFRDYKADRCPTDAGSGLPSSAA